MEAGATAGYDLFGEGQLTLAEVIPFLESLPPATEVPFTLAHRYEHAPASVAFELGESTATAFLQALRNLLTSLAQDLTRCLVWVVEEAAALGDAFTRLCFDPEGNYSLEACLGDFYLEPLAA